MYKILITGKKSYVGNMTEKWLMEKEEDYQIDKLSMRTDEWKSIDLGIYDSIIHVAGIAHNSSNKKLEELYYSVNRDLTIDLAKKAKEDGVKQFIFLSSITVYGTKNEVITEVTKPNPENSYSNSKLQAEEGILPLSDEKFKIVIVRPPMIYGKGSKGNYPKLAKLAKITPIFPDYPNKRSMIYIDNLCELLSLLVINEEQGVFHPQNKELVSTTRLVKEIAITNNNIVKLTKIFNPLIRQLSDFSLFNKVFGNLYYLQTLSTYKSLNYLKYDFFETINRTEL